MEALVTIRVLDYHERPVRGIVLWAVETNNQQVYQSATGDDGKARFLLPKGQPFQLNAEGVDKLKTFRTVNDKFVRTVYVVHIPQQDFTEETRGDTIWQRVSPAQTPTLDRVKVLFTAVDLDKKPLEGEAVFFTGRKTGNIYAVRTNSLGRAHFMLPEGDTFCIGLAFENNIECLNLPVSDRAGTLRLTLTTIGTKAFLKRKAERERQLAIRDSIFQAQRLQDSITQAERLAKLSKEDFLYQLELGRSLEEVQKNVEQQAAAEKDSLALDEHYFEKSGKDVEAVLYRMRQEWKNKVIVTDITCSMDPFMDQILIWHALQLTQNENNRYLFFNDGDGKPFEEKITGQTGGIHFIETKKMQELLTSMAESKSYGCSGDGPENDLEALLEGVKKMSGVDELILVADNYSDVRDIELLEKLEIPVRIILAGIRWGVNEQYLEIAFKTGGSVHTIEQDIDDLAKLADGETIEIGAHLYRVNRGKFIKVSKM
ncbi:MAG: hypothetical protein DHS20C18_38040 [Saprospiraceae bacterium]|nr:MAG: hypothetical protein DHS20C18_38040 [Saprospiraceae bacterium]